MASTRQLLADGHAKRADLVKVWIDHIHVDPGFNAPETEEDFEARVQAVVDHLISGGSLPPIEVRDRPEGGVFIVEGHARTEGTKRAAAMGLPVHDKKDGRVYMLTIPFTGNDLDRNLRIVTSAKGRQLNPLQIGAVLKRNRNLGQPVADIAKGVSLSVERVNQLLALADANGDVQQMVRSGEVSASVAAKAQRKHKEGAGEVLKEQLDAAKAEGKKRLTASVVAPKRVKASELEGERARLDWLVEQRAVVVLGGRMSLSNPQEPARNGYWVRWPDDDRNQQGTYESARAAIDAAMVEAQAEQ